MNLIIDLNRYLQIECFIVFWRPALILSFCNLSSSFAGEMWTNQIDFNKWLESLRLGPFQIICCHNWKHKCITDINFSI